MKNEKLTAELLELLKEVCKLPPDKQLEFLFMLKGAAMAISCNNST